MSCSSISFFKSSFGMILYVNLFSLLFSSPNLFLFNHIIKMIILQHWICLNTIITNHRFRVNLLTYDFLKLNITINQQFLHSHWQIHVQHIWLWRVVPELHPDWCQSRSEWCVHCLEERNTYLLFKQAHTCTMLSKQPAEMLLLFHHDLN